MVMKTANQCIAADREGGRPWFYDLATEPSLKNRAKRRSRWPASEGITELVLEIGERKRNTNLNDFLDYDWGRGALEPERPIRRERRAIAETVEVLRNQVRADGSEPEDVWLTDGWAIGRERAWRTVAVADPANPSLSVSVFPPSSSAAISAEAAAEEEEEEYYIEGIDDWRDGFYEPMGYHTGGSGSMLHAGIWGNPRLRQHIWHYCPEVKMTLAMAMFKRWWTDFKLQDVAKYVPGDCGANWKRDGQGMNSGSVGFEDLGYGTETIDGVAYPRLPPNLVPW
ncbi:hypothetical protein NUW58_g8545 [Xylaria curta]|uniref:Uncharacterized protein n=1 Tax=Xylaria curta TaxID=42375 RepID=A0ACC1N7A6_9PEZI|nr:hypothetical protein NUW58_g8545 [Xylaria curta]